jgi:hypothetical protein
MFWNQLPGSYILKFDVNRFEKLMVVLTEQKSKKFKYEKRLLWTS